MRDFHITYFHGPFYDYIDREEVVSDIAAAGFTLVPLAYGTEKNRSALRVLSEYGLSAMIGDGRIGEVYAKGDLAAADEVVREVVDDYKDFENITGWDIVDEPSADKFPVLAAIVNAFRRYSPELETNINLFPNYATPAQLGNPDYISHLESFVNTVRPHHISYDHYHFIGRKRKSEEPVQDVDDRERLIRESAERTKDRPGFFENIEDVRDTARKYGLDAMLIVLLTEHGPYRNLTYSELLWEVNMCLAYGMRRISYFTYWEPSYDSHWQWCNAICDTTGNKMQHYYDVQNINSRIMDVGRYLFGKNSVAVVCTDGTSAAVIPDKKSRIKKIESCSPLTAGVFGDGSIYVVNADYKDRAEIRVTADGAFNRFGGRYFAPFGENTLRLDAGEGILIK